MTSSSTNSLHVVSNSSEFTRNLGRVIGEQASAGDVVLLTGELGAGKTCLTQGIALGLGVEATCAVPLSF